MLPPSVKFGSVLFPGSEPIQKVAFRWSTTSAWSFDVGSSEMPITRKPLE